MSSRPWLPFYDADVPHEIRLEDTTLPALLDRTAARHPDLTALYFLNARLTFAELKAEVDRCAAGLAGLGVAKDSRVALLLPNIPQTVIAYHAVMRLGAQAVLTNPLYTPREIAHQWGDAGCTVAVVMDFLFEQKLRERRSELPVREYVIASIPDYLRFPLNLLAPLKLRRAKPAPMIARVAPGPGIHRFRDLLRGAVLPPPAVTVEPDDIAVLQYTGGTTGLSKGAMLSHRNLAANIQQIHAWLPFVVAGRDSMLTALPIFHVFGMNVCMNFPIAAGLAQVLVPNPRDLEAVLGAIEKHRVAVAPLTPAHFFAFNQMPGIEKRDLKSTRVYISGSAPLSVDVLERFEHLSGGRICEGFGLTETSPCTQCNPLRGRRKIGSIGIPLPNTDAKIVDAETGTRDLPHGEPGELLLKGPQVMVGYWNQPAETAQVLRDGWLFTGDLATMDDEGFCTIVGRKKEMIDVSGLKVYPDEVDRVLMSHAAVLEAATIGVPDERRGETVKSFVVLKPGAHATSEELTVHCRAVLAPYKVPRAIEFRPELPKSAILKILRRTLLEEEIAKLGVTA